jgi:hypothetical protein
VQQDDEFTATFGVVEASTLITPSFDMALHAEPDEAKVGDTISVIYQVTNTGNVTITSIVTQVTDAQAMARQSVPAAPSADLAPGDTVTGSIPVFIPLSDWPGPA